METKTTLETIRGVLEKVLDFTKGDLQELLTPLAEEEGRGPVYWPLRVALSGCEASPDPLEIAEILGKEEVLRRIDVAINKLGENKA